MWLMQLTPECCVAQLAKFKSQIGLVWMPSLGLINEQYLNASFSIYLMGLGLSKD